MKAFNTFVALLLSMATIAQQVSMEKTISISAAAKEKVNPDQVVFGLNVEQKGANFEEAVKQMDKTINEAKKILLKKKIDKSDIKTSTYNVQKNYYWENGKRHEDGFIGRSRLEAKTKFNTKLINDVLSKFGKESPDLNLIVSFAVSDDLQEATKNELLGKAVIRAKNKALQICHVLGKQLKDVKNITYNEGGNLPIHQKNYGAANMRAASAQEMAPVEYVQEVELSLTVQTIWIIE